MDRPCWGREGSTGFRCCTITMTELLVELTDGLVHDSQVTKLRFTGQEGKTQRPIWVKCNV